jgi:hypothetical protein
MLTGKYSATGQLPKGPRGLLFRQILPGIQPLLGAMQAIAEERTKSSVSQVICLLWPQFQVLNADCRQSHYGKERVHKLGA